MSSFFSNTNTTSGNSLSSADSMPLGSFLSSVNTNASTASQNSAASSQTNVENPYKQYKAIEEVGEKLARTATGLINRGFAEAAEMNKPNRKNAVNAQCPTSHDNKAILPESY